jgi:hypothetical protein
MMRLLYIGLAFVAVLALLAAIPTLLGLLLDPLNSRRIRNYCADLGLENVSIKAFPNHYGVEGTRDGRTIYAKCRVVGTKIKWKGSSPSDLLKASDAV